jgi:hypothetical protein
MFIKGPVASLSLVLELIRSTGPASILEFSKTCLPKVSVHLDLDCDWTFSKFRCSDLKEGLEKEQHVIVDTLSVVSLP